MAGLAYLFLPISGALAYFNGKRPRTRFHGLQAVLLGVLWPAALYAGSAIGPGATFGAAVAGAVIWLAFMLIALGGKDPRLPLIGKTLQRWAADPSA